MPRVGLQVLKFNDRAHMVAVAEGKAHPTAGIIVGIPGDGTVSVVLFTEEGALPKQDFPWADPTDEELVPPREGPFVLEDVSTK